MPDRNQILLAVAVAAVLSGAALLVCAWPWRVPAAARRAFGWVSGVALGFYAGCWLLGLQPKWPLREDADRFLVLIIPVCVLVELIAARTAKPRWLCGALRLLLAAGIAPLLLHDTVYVADLSGPGSREWTPTQAAVIFAGLATAVAGVWWCLNWAAIRGSGRALTLALSLVCGAAAVTVMLSGYSTGGQLGLPLSAALGGAAIASFLLAGAQPARGAIGLGVVGLSSLLMIGHFFGQLTTMHAILLFAAPLLAVLPELPAVRRLRPWLRGGLAVALPTIVAGFVVMQAGQRFAADSKPSSGTKEPSLQDYMDFGR